MKFVGIVGSNAEQSYNRMLLQFIQRHFKVKFELELLEYIKIGFKDIEQLHNINNSSVFYLNNLEKELFRKS